MLRISRNVHRLIPAITNNAVRQYTGFKNPFQQPDVEDRRHEVLALYRQLLKMVPKVKEQYHIQTPRKQMNERLRLEFFKHKEIKEPTVVESLIFKAYQDIEEIQDHFKQRSHLVLFFAETDIPQTKQASQYYHPLVRDFFTKSPAEIGDWDEYLEREIYPWDEERIKRGELYEGERFAGERIGEEEHRIETTLWHLIDGDEKV